jgi:hypothetical protein
VPACLVGCLIVAFACVYFAGGWELAAVYSEGVLLFLFEGCEGQ